MADQRAQGGAHGAARQQADDPTDDFARPSHVVAILPSPSAALVPSFRNPWRRRPFTGPHCRGLKRINEGKVRDIYEVDAQRMLIVTTDRLSAFDVVLPDPIPHKGRVLNEISNFWFGRTGHIIPNHLTGAPLSSAVSNADELAMLEGRAVIVKRLQALPIEAVVRGYLIGSGWKDYQQTGAVCGIAFRPACSWRSACLSRSSRRPPRPRSASTTRISPSRRPSAWSAHRLPRRCAMRRSRSTTSPRSTRVSAASSSRTPSSNSAWMTPAASRSSTKC